MKHGLSIACFASAMAMPAWGIPSTLLARQAEPFQIESIAEFNEPWALAFLPNNHVLVTERSGSLFLVDPDTKVKSEISGVPSVVYEGQGGLGDVALHPQFEDNKLIYISYVEAGDNGTSGAVVARAPLALNDDGSGALGDLEIVWTQVPKVVGSGHFSHRILFGENATLWISSGDRQQFDPAQDMSGNLGKILRLNDDGSIPADNPFAEEGGVTAEIWALGVRNPLGFDLDEEGNIWEVEMGPAGGDELNLIEEGGNYGWPMVSQGDHYDGEPIPDHDTRPEFIPPKVFWNPVISPAGMIIYKGDLFPEWRGNALISGLGSQGIVRVEIDGDTAREAERLPMGRRTRTVRASADGALWTLEDGAGGRLLKLTPA
ncbi:hypothetical protein NLU13_9792 [Sarocladium strictum]|uniref:Glucose/Sorbosone dehydrogenase domain-containing protein n=1 Tax=Sarocladium strictum TaxID=5046 RepID=A0AA39L359_SARSR|nr:hypothetical protein NLU13_9792 [Sarocladium strictum]